MGKRMAGLGSSSLLVVLLSALAIQGAARASDDMIESMRGVERVADPIVGQGRNTSVDRAYALWAQTDANQTLVLERPHGKRWISVADSILFARQTWCVNIVDETGCTEVGNIKFAMSFAEVDKEFALPLFLTALEMAVSRKQDCYVEQDDDDFYNFGFRSYRKGTVHIRRARALQPGCDRPCDCQPDCALPRDEAGIRKLEANAPADAGYLAPAKDAGTKPAAQKPEDKQPDAEKKTPEKK